MRERVCLQVGEFYETMGTDAVLLVQHAGLNPMGQGDPPRAGCPIGNLRRTVADLVEQAGLSVVSCSVACACSSMSQYPGQTHGAGVMMLQPPWCYRRQPYCETSPL